MDHGQLLPHDGHGPLCRLLALLWRPPATNATAGRRLRYLRRRHRHDIARLQRRYRSLPYCVGICLVYVFRLHDDDQHCLLAYLSLCQRGLLGLVWCLLEGVEWRLRNGRPSTESKFRGSHAEDP